MAQPQNAGDQVPAKAVVLIAVAAERRREQPGIERSVIAAIILVILDQAVGKGADG